MRSPEALPGRKSRNPITWLGQLFDRTCVPEEVKQVRKTYPRRERSELGNYIINDLLKPRGFTTSDLARALGASVALISSITYGDKRLTEERARQMTKAMKLKPEQTRHLFDLAGFKEVTIEEDELCC